MDGYFNNILKCDLKIEGSQEKKNLSILSGELAHPSLISGS